VRTRQRVRNSANGIGRLTLVRAAVMRSSRELGVGGFPLEHQDSRRIGQITSESLIACRNRNPQTPNLPEPFGGYNKPSRPAPRRTPQRRARPRRSVQFPLPFPEETVSNVIARSALFAAVKSKDRRQMRHEIVASQEGIEISFTGEQLNQDDHDNFMQLVKLASGRPLGQTVVVPANAILRTLGRSTGKSQHEQLRADMDRLISGTVTIKAKGLEYIGHLIDDALQDSREPVHKRHWAYRLNPRLVTLFAPNSYTLNNWETRQQLSQKELARWLQLWLESHAQNFATGVDTIRERCGSRNASLRDFRYKLKTALDDLKAAGVIHNWAIDAGDLVHIDRTPSDSQLGHVRKKRARRR
jgi:TrfA protein